MHILLAMLIASVTVAPFVPYTHLASSLAYGDIAVTVGLLGVAATSAFRLILPSMALWPIAIGILGLVSLSYAVARGAADGGFSDIGYVVRWFYFGLLVVFVAATVRADERAPRAVLDGILLAAVITTVWGWAVWFLAPQYIDGLPMLHVIVSSDWVINRNYIGYFLGIGVVLAFALASIEDRKGRKMLLYAVFGFLLFSALVSMSKGTWLAAFGPIFGYWLYRLSALRFRVPKIRVSLMIFSGLMVVIFIIMADMGYISRYASSALDRIESSGTTNAQRLQFIGDASSMMLRYPLLGVGPKRYREAAIAEGLEPTGDPHNAVLWIGAELGVPAALALVAMFASVGLLLFQKARRSGAKIWFPVQMAYASILFQVPLQGLPVSSKHLWILIGLVAGIGAHQRKVRK